MIQKKQPPNNNAPQKQQQQLVVLKTTKTTVITPVINAQRQQQQQPKQKQQKQRQPQQQPSTPTPTTTTPAPAPTITPTAPTTAAAGAAGVGVGGGNPVSVSLIVQCTLKRTNSSVSKFSVDSFFGQSSQAQQQAQAQAQAQEQSPYQSLCSTYLSLASAEPIAFEGVVIVSVDEKEIFPNVKFSGFHNFLSWIEALASLLTGQQQAVVDKVLSLKLESGRLTISPIDAPANAVTVPFNPLVRAFMAGLKRWHRHISDFSRYMENLYERPQLGKLEVDKSRVAEVAKEYGILAYHLIESLARIEALWSLLLPPFVPRSQQQPKQAGVAGAQPQAQVQGQAQATAAASTVAGNPPQPQAHLQQAKLTIKRTAKAAGSDVPTTSVITTTAVPIPGNNTPKAVVGKGPKGPNSKGAVGAAVGRATVQKQALLPPPPAAVIAANMPLLQNPAIQGDQQSWPSLMSAKQRRR